MPASIGVNMRVTGHYSQGGRKYMEDKFSVAYQQTEDEKDLEYAYFGIFDGHGGSEAADFAKEHLMDSIVKQRQFWSDNDSDVLRAIRNGYMMTHLNMWKELDKWPKTVSGLPSTAGTTASVAFIRGGKIYIGHVGDSAIILGYQVEGQEKWCAKALTSDHKPDCMHEMTRIASSGGKVVAKAGVHRVVWNRPAIGPGGSLRCDEIPFLAVARSLGDLWSYNSNTDEFIVSPDPDVGVLAIDPSRYRCLIFGTDGLWNMVSAEAAVQLVQVAEKHNEKAPPGAPAPDAWLNPSKILVDSALQRWSSTKMRADNTSVVTLMMDPPGPPRNRTVHPSPPAPIPAMAAPPPTEHTTAEESEDPRSSDSPPPDRESTSSPTFTKKPPEHRPPPPPPISQPFTYTTVKEEEETFITNYGSPSDSYFIARLLNKTQIRNTLQDVYQEITTTTVLREEREIIKINNNEPEETPLPKTTVLQRPCVVSPAHEPSARESLATPSSPTPPPEEALQVDSYVEESTVITPVVPPPPPVQENIQINEVSSSSPVDAPPKPPKTRKSKLAPQQLADEKPLYRSLRSHDTPPPALRPQTRFAIKARYSLPPQPGNRMRNNVETKVPIAVHGSNNYSSKISSQQVVLVNKPHPPAAPARQDDAKNVTKKHVPVIAKIKQPEPKTKPSAAPPKPDKDVAAEPARAHASGRLTRSKDTASPAELLLKSVKDTAIRKAQSTQPTLEGECSKPKENRPSIMTRQRNTTPQAAAPSTVPRTFLRRQAMESENSKENLLTPPAETTPATVPLKSVKRRNSGGGLNDLEPKEKRRTRLDDKKKSDRGDDPQEDVSSTEHNKDSNAMLGLSVATVVLQCVAELPTKRTLRNLEDVVTGKCVRLRNKKEKKANGIDDSTSSEVHSTTINLENEPDSKGKSSTPLRALRSRQDNVQSKAEEDKRLLRSTERSADHVDKECRPVLRSKNIESTPKLTPRRIRTPWRQSLRKRFSKN